MNASNTYCERQLISKDVYCKFSFWLSHQRGQASSAIFICFVVLVFLVRILGYQKKLTLESCRPQQIKSGWSHTFLCVWTVSLRTSQLKMMNLNFVSSKLVREGQGCIFWWSRNFFPLSVFCARVGTQSLMWSGEAHGAIAITHFAQLCLGIEELTTSAYSALLL